jgi:hypothetical protein
MVGGRGREATRGTCGARAGWNDDSGVPGHTGVAAAGEQAVGDREQQDLIPGRPLAAGREPLAPELLDLDLRPELVGQPARAPLPRTLQAELARALLDANVGRMRGDGPGGGEQGEAELLMGAFLERLDAMEPAGFLAIVELPEVEQPPIAGPPVGAPTLPSMLPYRCSFPSLRRRWQRR